MKYWRTLLVIVLLSLCWWPIEQQLFKELALLCNRQGFWFWMRPDHFVALAVWTSAGLIYEYGFWILLSSVLVIFAASKDTWGTFWP